ncbi:recombinase family protein [Candidatus Lokiarchaeum ossiferum]|uniref:recombinase family protein n=1 Tax=Candidatus Lokiarchaeum ossiferum TaxID=2951803 RepID=UPI00352C079F
MKKKIFAYYRISTEKQKKKNTQENQKKVIAEFVKGLDVEIVREFEDLGISGADNERPQFILMLSLLKDVDGLVIYDLDRLTRDFEMGVNLMFLLKNTKKSLYIARTKDVKDFSDDSEQLMTIIKSWVSALERKKIKERQKIGIQRYIENKGRWGRKKTFGKYKIPDQFWKNYDTYREMGISKTGCAKLLGISRSTMNRRVEEREQDSLKINTAPINNKIKEWTE